jgi:hypothetical protein
MAKKLVTISRRPRTSNVATGSEGLEDVLSTLPPTEAVGVRKSSNRSPSQTASKKQASNGFYERTLYGATYYATYGIVYSALVVGALIPGSRVIGQAFSDATKAAKDDFSGTG